MQYEIVGAPYPVVVCHLEAGERMKTEQGSMTWMDPCFEMQTTGGGIKKMFGKVLSQEGLFDNIYVANQPGKIAFGSSFPGDIIPLEIAPNREFVVQKRSFLASEAGVELSVHFNQSLGGGFFGGEGFIMQKLSGQGVAFVEVDGSLVRYDLQPGQQLLVDTGSVMGFSVGVTMDVQQVKGLKNKLIGGEGWFNTRLTGPGTVWIQTMPMSSFIDTLLPFIKTGNK